ncbi:hypothetical protein HYC85_028681 [Camellia sinensis]|uniref:RRM domain-containing protein n=1 Tax=Camellia sinensis TaxID=4442 RepID=A0A7J7FVT2_CAMSI|nr:hypothetical protein HYC85_028681 [Camellia sinensis]
MLLGNLQNGHPQITERELTSANDGNVAEDLMQNHDVFLSTLWSHLTKLQVVRHFWEQNNIKGAIDATRKLPDHSVGIFWRISSVLLVRLKWFLLGRLEGKIVGEKRKKIDDSVDMVVSKEGFDDEDKLLRTVFVGNLTLKVKKKALFKEFSQFGEVESTKKPTKGAIIQKKINDAVDSVHAYIVFETEQAAQASLAHNMDAVGGNHIRVDRACPPRKKLKGDNAPLYDNKRMVFVVPFCGWIGEDSEDDEEELSVEDSEENNCSPLSSLSLSDYESDNWNLRVKKPKVDEEAISVCSLLSYEYNAVDDDEHGSSCVSYDWSNMPLETEELQEVDRPLSLLVCY